MPLTHILETCLYVADLAAAENFYTQVLGLELLSSQAGRHVFLRCGRQMLLLFDPDVSEKSDGDFPAHGTRGAGHIAFAAGEAELPAWRERLERAGVAIEKVIDWPSGGRSLYFRDPSGISLELATPKIWGLDEDVAR
jgi:catechol 2,3-dioxygenase-like lactoylglutathione lyase family enzyme